MANRLQEIFVIISFSLSINPANWTIGLDPAYEAVKQASEYFAASEILGRYQNEEEGSQNEWDRGNYLLKIIKENIAAATAGEDENIGRMGSMI